MLSAVVKTLICIDSNIYNYQSLIKGLDSSVEILILDKMQNGITKITEALYKYPFIRTVHIISHGSPGCLYLGNSSLNLETIEHYSLDLQSWFPRNSESRPAVHPQILLYGCNVAVGDAGDEFLSKLHRLTQASIAASTTFVGQTALGSNWQLNYQLGQADAENPIAPDVLHAYQGVLAPPVITDTLTTTRSTPEEASLTISGLSIADSDTPTQSVTLAVTHGALLLASTTGLTVTGNGSSSITLSGLIANVNAALSGMTYTPNLNYADSETLAITTNDGTTTVSKNVAIAVTPVNDIPTIAPTAVSIAEGSTGSFAAINFGLSDVDNIAAQIIIKIAALPGKGYLTFNGSRLVVGSTLSSDQIPQLQYHHDGTQTTAVGGTSDSFQVTVDDGAGGAIAATNIPITITPVNQLPTVGGTNTLFEGQANYPVTITISDPDQTASTYGIKIISLPSDGALKLNGTAVSVNQSLTTADLANLTFSHDGNDANTGNPPNVSFQVQVLDDGGGTGTPGTTTAAIAFTIRPNNDDPVLTQNNGLTLNTQTEGLTKVLTSADLQVTDPDSGTLQLTFTIKQAPDPTQGTIQRFNGTTWQNLGVGTTFTQDDLNSGLVRYSFHKSTTAGETLTDSFQFEVRDGEITEYPTVREGGIWKPDGSALDIATFNISITTPVASGGSGGTEILVAGNALPTTVNNTGFAGLLEGETISITNTMLKTTDSDNSASEIVYRIGQTPTSGIIRVNGLSVGLYGSFTQNDIDTGNVTFVHNGDEDFLDSFRFTVSDGTNVLAQQTFNIDITPQNDSPTVAVNGSPNTVEAGTVNITNVHLSFADVDGTGEKSGTGYATPNVLTFTVTTLPGFGILQVDQGSGYIDVTTSTIITKAQLDGNKLRYVHNGTENFTDSFSVQANDNTTEAPANNLSTIKTVNIEIASLNDAPVFSSSKNLVVAEGEIGSILGENGVAGDAPRLVYTDTDSTTVQRQYRINTSTAYGSVLLNGKVLASGSVFTQDDLNNSRVAYKHNGSENYTDGFTFEVRDGSAAPVAGNYAISITPKNDPPTLVVPATQTFSTTTPLTFNSANGNRIVIDDPDLLVVENGETDVIQVTLDFQATGATYTGSTLTLGSTTGLTITQGTSGTAGGKITVKGTKADVQAALDGLQVQVPADEDRVLSLVVTVDDLLNGDPIIASTGAIITQAINLNTSNVNDAPTVANPASISVNEDMLFSFTGANTISIADVDTFTSANNTVTVSVTQGKLTLASTGLITGGANNSSSITLTGSLAAINTALSGLSYQGNVNVNGSDTLSISFNDQGNIGTGGAQITTQTVGITLVPVNDAPSLAAPSGVQTIASANVLTFNAANNNAISIDDIFDLNPALNATVVDNFTVTLNATNGGNTEGLLTVASGSGATIGGSGGNITITGTKSQVNAALNGLTYDPAAYNADVSLNLAVTVSDNANGGPGTLTASKNVTINVSDTNDPAVVTAPLSVSVNEDTAFPFSGANQITVADPDDFGNPLKVTLTVGKGTLTLGALTGLTFTSGDGISDTTMTFQGSESAINTALQSLSYLGNADFNSTVADTLNIQINDLGNTGTGGAQIVNKTVNITVNPINDAPTRTAAITTLATVLEDSAPAGDTIANLFGSKFQDVKDNQTANTGSAANTLAGVAITNNGSASAQGKWQWFDGSSWNNITTGASTASALILSDTTLVRFLPTANFNGTPGNLTVRLIDSSSGAVASGSTVDVTVSGGVTQYSDNLNRVTLGTTVTAVNDAPVASGSATLTAIAEDTAPASILGATISSLFTSTFSDVTDQVTDGSAANTLVGVAIVGNAATTQGTWEYFSGGSWQSVGTPTSSTALIVSGADKLRFVPSLNYNGAVPALTVHLIDNSSGSVTTGTTVNLSVGGATGGTTVYSSTTVPLTTTINAVNDAPTLTSLGGAVSFTENGSPVVLDGNAIAQDIELDAIANWNGSTLTLQRQGGANAQDVFSSTGALGTLTQGSALVVGGTTIGAVTTNTNGALVLTFASNATGALVTSALQQIAYSNSSDNPPAAVTINYALNDQNTAAQGTGGALIGTGAVIVNITAVNDPPVLDLDANNSSTATGANYKASFTENGSAVAIGDVDVSVTDLDNTNIASATITLTNRVDGAADVLSVVGGLPGGITASAYNPTTGVITLTGSATLANYQSAIAQIKYSNTSDNPTATDRSITVVVNDGTANSNTATTTISIVPVNDPPVLDLDANNSSTATGTSYKTTFTENGSAVAIGDVDVSITDLDNANIASATITLTNRVDGAADVLSVVGALPGGITASAYNSATGVITLTGSATLASYQAAIAQIAYSNISDNPTAVDRSITVVVSDGAASSNIATTTISIVPVNDPPVLDLDANNSSTATGTSYKTTFTENGSAVAIGDVDVSVTDLDNANIASATITLTNRVDGAADVLSVVGGLPGGITASAYNSATGVITLTGSATLASYQAAIAQIAYSNTSDNPTAVDRSITVVVNDGTADSNIATATILIDPNPDGVNDAITLEEDSTSNSINVLANDLDQGNGPATITAVSDPSSGLVTIDTNGTSDSTDDVLRYTPNADFNGSDSFTYTITDADGDTSTATIAITVNPVIDAVNDTLTTAEVTPRSMNLLANDLFQPGAQLTGATQGTNGSVLFNPGGTVTYTPNASFVGVDSFTYTVTTTAGNTETATVNVIVNRDSDGDTIADIDDLDDDNDGIPDAVEENGTLNRDTDSDGIVDRLDLDADSDGITDVIEAGHTALDSNHDGRVDGNPVSFGINGLFDSLETSPDNGIIIYQPKNTDGDRVYDFQDLDSDNDGINDVIEAGGQDADGNGLIDGFNLDANSNGIADGVDSSPLPSPDTDSDGAADYQDLDSDNDGLPDLAEAGLDPVVVDTDGDGVIDAADPDGDGIQTLVDGNPSGFGDRNSSTNSTLSDGDRDGTPDYRELDSDNDDIPDRIKAGLPAGAGSPDANGDGKVDNPFDADKDGIADSIDVKPGIYGGFDSKDSDGDGITDIYDLDDDNDGIRDTIEQNGNPERDTDGDGVIDRLDLDSDNDGILDVKEAGHQGFDSNGDGKVDAIYGKNGLADLVETSPESGISNYIPVNTDGDSVPDFQDLDSDNDGISDVIEAGGKDPDGDGIIDQGKPTDTNGNGLTDSVDSQLGGTPLLIPDQDGDGQPNFRDLDSDNDGIFDLLEQGLSRLDTNGDGKIDGADRDRDGLIDTLDGNSGIFGSGSTPLPAPSDQNGNGTPDFLEPPTSTGGSQGADDVVGTNSDDILNGFSDIDVLRGLGGNDLINGGSSRDTMYGNEGNDILNGGSDDDYMNGGNGKDRLNGGTGNDSMFGGDGDDILDGGEGNDLVRGNRSRDIINGGDGKDRLYGDQENDIIQGNRGNDLLVGGFGKDTLTGGQGRDRFAYKSVKEFRDSITDFEIIKDRIDVKSIKGINSIRDLQFTQQGHDTLISAYIGNGFQTLAVLQDVRANTLTPRHFIF